MNNAVETIQYKGREIQIHQDLYPESPRSWDNLGTMLCAHGRYTLGDEQPDVDTIKERAEECEKAGGLVLPLYLYDHSGITISTKPFSCPWDSGQVGVILLSAEVGRKEYGRQWRKRAAKYLVGEVETYDQYLRGDVYGYVVKGADGDDGDSCWGYYGTEAAIEEAKSVVDCAIKYEEKEKKACAAIMAL